ncbi:MAG: putative sulfate exporter family transporter [Opitutaceae bacterium]|jgi:uncharacterized integral membrane protein (TIGR00698 family)
MHTRRHRTGIAFTALLAVAACVLAELPGLRTFGPLSLALVIGMLWRALLHVPAEHHTGIGFSARSLLRLGIVLLGVRLDFDLVLHAGLKILLLDVGVIGFGLVFITWLGQRLGLSPTLAALIAVDSSICGASAVAAAAPVLRADENDTSLVIPMGGLLGTGAMLAYAAAQHAFAINPRTYGLLSGSTLQEIAQVLAAVTPVPGALAIGTVTKLTRVVLLAPALYGLGLWHAKRLQRTGNATVTPARPWFVLGFLLVGVAATLAHRVWPESRAQLDGLDAHIITLATFLMTMAMAGMGLQVDFTRLRASGLRAAGTVVVGWLVLAGLALIGVRLIA